jgi:hypothetical protein
MAPKKTLAVITLPVQPDPTAGMRFIARQPILDLREHVHGFELLFRSGPEAFFHSDGNLATRTMLDNTVIFGLESLPAVCRHFSTAQVSL